jgi:hypothetical protein
MLVEAGGDGAVAFESVDAAFHGLALAADVRVEGWWPATPRPEFAWRRG